MVNWRYEEIKTMKKNLNKEVWRFHVLAPDRVCMCGQNTISSILQGRQIYIIFSFSSCSSQTQKNGGNLVTLATGRAYVLRKAADGGGRRGKGRHGDEDRESKKKTGKRVHISHITHALSWLAAQFNKSGSEFLFHAQRNDPSFPLSVHAICQTDPLYFFYLLDTRRLFKHNLFPQGPPQGAVSDLYSLVFFPLLLLVMILLYLFTAGCLFFHWLFYKGSEWALSRPCWASNRNVLTHTSCLSARCVSA